MRYFLDKILYVIISFIITLSLLGSAYGSGAYVGNAGTTPTQLNQRELIDVFTLVQSHWYTGYPVTIVLYSSDSVQFRSWVVEKLGMTTISYERILQSRLLLSSNTNPPVYVRTDSELVYKIISRQGAIAYLDGSLHRFNPYRCKLEDLDTMMPNDVLEVCFNEVVIVQ